MSAQPPKPPAVCSAILAVVWLLGPTACRSGYTQPQHYIESGDRFAEQGKLREAVVEYRNAAERDPASAVVHLKLARAYETLGEGEQALGEFVRAADLRQEDLALQLKAAEYLMAAGRHTDALARADAVLTRDPESVEGHVLRGRALAALERLDEALDAMRAALELQPSRAATHTQLGIIQAAGRQPVAAEQSLRRAVELAPDAVDGHLALANFYWTLGRVDDAEGALTNAVRADARHERANRAMAMLLQSSGRGEKAESYLRRVVEVSGRPESVFMLADYYIAMGRPADAIGILGPLTHDRANAPTAKLALARAHRAQRETAAALAIIDALLDEDPEYPEALVLKGRLLADGQDTDAAIAALQAAVSADPSLVSAHLALGQVYGSRGDLEGAEAALREALRLDPGAAAAQVELSLLHLTTNRAGTALSAARQAVRRQPRSAEARLALVRSAIAAGDLDLAERELSLLASAKAAAPDVLVARGLLANARGNRAGARAAFLGALELESSSTEALSALVSLHLRAGEHEAARRLIDERLSAGPETAPLLLLAARTFTTIGDSAMAERLLRRAIDIAPTMVQAYALLGELYFARGDYDSALAEFDRLATKVANPVGPLTMAGMILQKKADLRGAQARFERALAANPTAAVAANNLAWIFTEQPERLGDAVRLARLAAEQLPDSPEVLDTLGWAYVRNGTPLQAVQPLSRCAEIEPRNGICRYHLGVALSRIGEVERSRQMMTEAIARGGDASWVADARVALNGLDQTPVR